jgi:hypothetical protein
MRHPLAIRWAEYEEVGPTNEEIRRAFYAGAVAMIAITENNVADFNEAKQECRNFLDEWGAANENRSD